MKNLILAAIIIAFVHQIKAQINYGNSQNIAPCDKSLSYFHPSRHVTIYKIGNQQVDYRTFREALDTFKDSADELRKYKRSMAIGGVALGGSFISLMIALQTKPTSPATILFIPLGFFAVEITELIIADHHFRKSIKLYNQHVC